MTEEISALDKVIIIGLFALFFGALWATTMLQMRYDLYRHRRRGRCRRR